MTISVASWQQAINVANSIRLFGSLLTVICLSSTIYAQDLNGQLTLDQTHTGTQFTENIINVEDFSGTYIKDTTLAVGNQVIADLQDGGATITQLQTGIATAYSTVNVGKGTLLLDTSIVSGNAITLTGDGNVHEFTANISQTNSGPTTADILLNAGAIEFYGAILDVSGNDGKLTSDQFRSNFLLNQENSGDNVGIVRQSGGLSSAKTNIVISGNKANFGSKQQIPAREPAYRQ